MIENGSLTLCLEGRIDSTNAPAVEDEIFAAVNANPGATVTLDADRLEYISSAGLRVLMKLRKKAGKALPVLNVSPEIFTVRSIGWMRIRSSRFISPGCSGM